MISKKNIFAVVITGSIIGFSLIHIGVSIGIIVPAREYGSIFGAQIGLSSFNLVVALVGLFVGICGLFFKLLEKDNANQILAIAAGVLAIFAMASLIAALVINDKSLSNISGRFKDYMFDYQTKEDARTVVDLVQKNKECCGEDIWLDWARVQLNATDITVSNDTTSTMTTSTTTTEATTTTTTSTTSSSNNSSSADQTGDVNQNPDGRVAVNNPLHSDSYPKQPSSTENNSEKQVSEAGTTYGGINDLPISFGVILPASCCKSEAILLNSTENRYCQSNYNSVPNHFYTKGCSKSLDYTAGNQVMAFIVINSFMIVLALVSINIFFESATS